MNAGTDRDQWEPHVGKFVMSFTGIEHFVTITIDLLSRKTISRTARTLAFDKRVDLVVELLECDNKLRSDSKAKYVGQLKEARRLATNARNLIVHNPILIDLYQDPYDGAIYETARISSARNPNKKLSLPEVIEMAGKAERLEANLSDTHLELVEQYFGK